MVTEDLSKYIRSIPDFPKKGIVFKDITSLLVDKEGLRAAFRELYDFIKDQKIDKVVGIESRGFMFGTMLAEKLDAGFVPIRKPGKLPGMTIRETYELEYGTDAIEIHADAIKKGDRVLMHDDLLATGGTMEASCRLVEKLGGEIVQISFLIELSFLNGRDKLKKYDIRSLITYDSE
ncbi:MAG: adenine phosphoribosyltransferase [Methanococcaceae archaeon]